MIRMIRLYFKGANSPPLWEPHRIRGQRVFPSDFFTLRKCILLPTEKVFVRDEKNAKDILPES